MAKRQMPVFTPRQRAGGTSRAHAIGKSAVVLDSGSSNKEGEVVSEFEALVLERVLEMAMPPKTLKKKKSQIYHTTELAFCHCLRRLSISEPRIVMIKLSIAALAKCTPAGLFGAHFQRREDAHWELGRLQTGSG